MKPAAVAAVLVLVVSSSAVGEESSEPPWKVNSPIVSVKKELYRKHPNPAAAALVFVCYVGPDLQMREIRGQEIVDDVHSGRAQRFSHDNGKTWTKFERIPSSDVRYKGVTVWEGSNYSPTYDPVAGVLLSVWLRQIASGGQYNQATYYRLSWDYGRTWTNLKQLCYEAGDQFDPENPLAPGFLKRNQAYFGVDILRHSNGTLIHPVAHANAPGDAGNDSRPWRMGSLCFIGKWDAAAKDYKWTAGKRVEILPNVSSRGLMEPAIAELKDGRVLVIWRGSNTSTTPGRKWFSVSTDGGMTLSEVRELKYDDGSSFYSSSSFHRMIRHGVTGKLYWVGNISPGPPSGNSPRYPLVMAEVDEQIPALVKHTVTAIDDRQPHQTPAIQFSNFSLLEDRETHALVLYLTCYGEFPGAVVYTADNYKYVVTLK